MSCIKKKNSQKGKKKKSQKSQSDNLNIYLFRG